MQRIAALLFVSVLKCVLTSSAAAQIITAQPARNFNASPPQSNYQTAYSAPPTAPSLLQSPEANTIRGWYRDYLGRDAGQDGNVSDAAVAHQRAEQVAVEFRNASDRPV